MISNPFRRAVLAVVLGLPPAAPLLAVAPAVDDVLATVQDAELPFSLDDLTANDMPGAVIASLDPAVHGSVACAGDQCVYHPPTGFTGADRFHYVVGNAPGAPAVAEVRVQVSPIVSPIAGDWDRDGTTDLGWFHAGFRDFFFFQLDVTTATGPTLRDGSYRCDRPWIPEDFEGSIPLAGDWDGDRSGEIGLFDPVSREFLLYDQETESGEWIVASRFVHPTPGQGGLPVAGDWNGDGADEVGVFLDDEHRFLLLAANGADAAVHDFRFDDLPTPRPWLPVAGAWGNDALAADRVGAWNPETGILRLRKRHTTGPTFEPGVAVQGWTGLLPLSGHWGHPGTIGFYDPGDGVRPARFLLYPCAFDPDCHTGGQDPILLPPPEDPLVTPCTAGPG